MSDNEETRLPIFYQNLLNFIREHPTNVRAIESHIRNLANSATLTEVEYSPEFRTVGHRAYDSLIENIFKWVIRAVSRTALLEQTIDALWLHNSSHATLCFFVLETVSTGRSAQVGEIKAVLQKGVNEHLWRNFSDHIQPRLHDSSFLRDLLLKGESFQLWLSNYIPNYLGEFDLLARASEQEAKNKSYWISAVALKSDQVGHVNRALVALYENTGNDLVPKFPPGANQEWRVLQFLGIAYQVLEYQLANVAEEVQSQRQRLLSLLAPGILHHEIGAQMQTIRDLVNMSQTIAERLDKLPRREEDTAQLQKNLQGLNNAASRLYHIADAFNNIERRRARETVHLDELFKEIETLTHHRLGNIGARLLWEPHSLSQTIETDPALLLHLLLNIVINAINACEESPNRKTQKAIIQVALSPKAPAPQTICLQLLNNGPPIPEELLDRIFEKGFTTRKEGHGHGLYICRLIAEALGGQIRALAQLELLVPWTAGFQVALPVVASRELDLIGERRARRL